MKIFRLIALFFLFITINVNGKEFLFSNLSIENGLSQTSAKAVLRDSNGYLWIGTKNGLNQYDEGHMECFFNNPSDPASLPGNEINDIFEDAHSNIWIICDRGVATYNKKSGNFERREYKGKPIIARGYFKAPDGLIFGGEGLLYYYDYSKKIIQTIPTSGGSNRLYTSIESWKPDRYLLSTRWDGLWLYNPDNGRIERLGCCQEKDIMTSRVDSEGRLWVSSYGEGLKCYDRTGQCLFNADHQTLGNGIVLDLLNLEELMWVATDGGGLHTININTFAVNDIGKDKKGLGSVNRLYHDSHGYIYAGTVREGIICITSSPMRTFVPGQNSKGNAVTSLLADGEDVWMGVDGGGISLYEPSKDNSFTRQQSTEGLKVTSIENYGPTKLIVSTFDKGFYILDKKSGALTNAPAIFNEIYSVNAKKGLPLDMQTLSDDQIAVLTDRIYIADIRDNSWKEIEQSLVKKRINEFFTDNHSMLCHSEGEIIKYDIRTGKVKTLATFPDRDITCAAFDGNHLAYIGTYSGIFQLDIESGYMSPVYNDINLPSRVTAIAINGKRMWIAAEGAIYSRDFDTGRICRFDKYDGVEPNEFISKAILSTPTQIYMGGVNGLLKINRTEVSDYIDHKLNRPIRITDVLIDGTEAFTQPAGHSYDIPYNHSTIALRVDGGDTHPIRHSPFRFYINSPNGEMPIESANNTFTINRLSSGGRYEIYAQTIASDGTWSSPQKVATLNVQRPWWKSPWAFALYILLCLATITFISALIIRRRKKLTEKKMADIRQKSLEKEVGFLMEMNHELRTPLTLIYSRLRGMIDRMKGDDIDDHTVLTELENIYQSTQRMRDIMNTTVDQWVESDPGNKDMDAAVLQEPYNSSSSDIEQVDVSDMTVIVAEEDPDLRAYIASNLFGIFGKIITAENGSQALTEIKNAKPDLIITDAMLSGKSGTELCRHIKQLDEFSHIPIIMLTTRVEERNLHNGHDLGADIYITKPFDMNQLTNRCIMVMRSFDRVKKRYKSNAADILPRVKYNNEEETFLLKVKEVIEQNISQTGFGIDTIVEKLLISRSSLYSKFKDLTGQSLGSYIDDYRITRAKEMLETTDMTMSEISDSLGFSTQRYFSTFFRKKTGISPSQYRGIRN